MADSYYTPEELAQMQEFPKRELARTMRAASQNPPDPANPTSPQLAPFLYGTPPLPGQFGSTPQPMNMDTAMQRTFYPNPPENMTGQNHDGPPPPLPSAARVLPNAGQAPQVDKTPMPDGPTPDLKSRLRQALGNTADFVQANMENNPVNKAIMSMAVMPPGLREAMNAGGNSAAPVPQSAGNSAPRSLGFSDPPLPGFPPMPKVLPKDVREAQMRGPGQSGDADMRAVLERAFNGPGAADAMGKMLDARQPGTGKNAITNSLQGGTAEPLSPAAEARLFGRTAPDSGMVGQGKSFPSPEEALAARFQRGSPGSQGLPSATVTAQNVALPSGGALQAGTPPIGSAVLPPDAEARLMGRAVPTGNQVSPDEALGKKLQGLSGFGELRGGYGTPMQGLAPEYAPGSAGANVQEQLAALGRRFGVTPAELQSAGTGAPSPEMQKYLDSRAPAAGPGSDNSEEAMARRRGTLISPVAGERRLDLLSGPSSQTIIRDTKTGDVNDAKTGRANIDTATAFGRKELLAQDEADRLKKETEFKIGPQARRDTVMGQIMTQWYATHPNPPTEDQLKAMHRQVDQAIAHESAPLTKPGGPAGKSPAGAAPPVAGGNAPPLNMPTAGSRAAQNLDTVFGEDVGGNIRSLANEVDASGKKTYGTVDQLLGKIVSDYPEMNIDSMRHLLPFLETTFNKRDVHNFLDPGFIQKGLARLPVAGSNAAAQRANLQVPFGELARKIGLPLAGPPNSEDTARSRLRSYLQLTNQWPYRPQ